MLEINGSLLTKMSVVEGDNARGHWMKGQFVVEQDNEYRTKLAFMTFSNEIIEMMRPLQPGTFVKVTFVMESREYNGRWYTDLRCTRFAIRDKAEAITGIPAQPIQPQQPERIMPEQPYNYDPLAMDEEPPF